MIIVASVQYYLWASEHWGPSEHWANDSTIWPWVPRPGKHFKASSTYYSTIIGLVFDSLTMKKSYLTRISTICLQIWQDYENWIVQ